MKIVFANNYNYIRGGAERVFFDEMEILSKHNHAVFPFSRKHPDNYQSVFDNFYPSELNYNNGNFFDKLKASISLIYSTDVKRKFTNFLNYVNPDIVHAHNIYGRLTTAIIDVAKELRIPMVMTLHDNKLICPSYLMLCKGKICEKCLGGKFYNALLTRCHKESFLASTVYTFESYFNFLFKKYDWVTYYICPSEFIMKKHIQAGFSEEKLIHIPNFAKVENFEPNYKVGNYILYAGRLSKEKGVMTLLKAIKGLDVKLKIVGDGPIRSDCERFVKENEINNVEFLGYKSGKNLEDLFKQSAFLVIPSECYENAPMTIIEAFSHGKPVVGSRIGGIPEMIIENETGFLFEMGNWQELREKIRYLLSTPSLIENMGKNARKKAEKEYSEEVHYNKLIDVYKKALSK